jgi:endonuclease/exonuclease/phosphatase (EEP) superfamily protein YafD
MHRKTNDERIAFVDTLQPPSHRTRHILLNLLFATVIVYLLFLVVWLITRTLFGDRWWWLFLLNAVTPYLLMPLPLLILPAIIARRWFAVALSIPLFVISAPLLIDPWLRFDTARYGFSSQGAPFRVMTFNINGGNERADRVACSNSRRAQPDIVALQELNPRLLPHSSAIWGMSTPTGSSIRSGASPAWGLSVVSRSARSPTPAG